MAAARRRRSDLDGEARHQMGSPGHTNGTHPTHGESRDQDDARVRYAVQSAIARFYHPEAYTAVKHVVESESNPMIVSRSLNAIGNYGNEEISAILLQFLSQTSYRNRLTEAAISAMGSQDDDHRIGF